MYDIEIDSAIQMGESIGLDYVSLLSALAEGDLSQAVGIAMRALGDMRSMLFSDITSMIRGILVPVFISAFVNILVKGSSGRRAISLITKVCISAALCSIFVQLHTTTMHTLDKLLKCSEAFNPILMTMSTLAGAVNTSAVLTPMTGLCTLIIQRLMMSVCTTLCSLSAITAVSGNICSEIRLGKLRDLLKKLLYWISGSVTTGFITLLTLQGRLSAGRDNTAARTVRFAAENLIPIIGGNISDSMDALLSSAVSILNVLGISGLLLLAAAVAVPALRIAAAALTLRFLSSAAEPMGDEGLSACISQFADATEMLLVILLASLVLCAMLVGSCMTASGNVLWRGST